MAGLVRKSFDAPEEVRRASGDMGRLDFVESESGTAVRATLEPGWQWSKHVKPYMDTDSCEVPTSATSSRARCGSTWTTAKSRTSLRATS